MSTKFYFPQRAVATLHKVKMSDLFFMEPRFLRKAFSALLAAEESLYPTRIYIEKHLFGWNQSRNPFLTS
jgi:hypothetical protein